MLKIITFFLMGLVSIGVGVGTRYLVDGAQEQKIIVSNEPFVCGTSMIEDFSLSASGRVEGNEKSVSLSASGSGEVKAYGEGSQAVRNCFQEKFATCSPAITFIQIPLFGLEFRYEIKNAVPGGCSLLAQYTKSPEPSHIGPEATCVYDNKNTFDVEANKFMQKCTGPLIDVLTEPIVSTPSSKLDKSVEVSTNSSVSVLKSKEVASVGLVQCGKAYIDTLSGSKDKNGDASFAKESLPIVDCYQKRLQNSCAKAIMTVSVADMLIFDYKILKQGNINECSVEAKIVEYDDPTVKGDTMTCLVNSRSVFSDGMKEALAGKKCTGPLVEFFAGSN